MHLIALKCAAVNHHPSLNGRESRSLRLWNGQIRIHKWVGNQCFIDSSEQRVDSLSRMR